MRASHDVDEGFGEPAEAAGAEGDVGAEDVAAGGVGGMSTAKVRAAFWPGEIDGLAFGGGGGPAVWQGEAGAQELVAGGVVGGAELQDQRARRLAAFDWYG